jgi:hypothetical protein
MTLRTDLIGGTSELNVHADQHNQVNAAVIAIQTQTKYRCNVYSTAGRAVGTGVLVASPLDTIDVGGDPNGNFNISTFVYTCPVVGIYAVCANAAWAAPAVTAGQQYCSIMKNSTEVRRGEIKGVTNLLNAASNVAGQIICAAGDTLGIGVFQSSGANLNIAAGRVLTWCDIYRMF